MKRLGRDHLYHSLISAVKFDKRMKNAVPNPVLYEILDIVCDQLCSTGRMVVLATTQDHLRSAGTFGHDEPWPEWVDRFELLGEGLIKSDPSLLPPQE